VGGNNDELQVNVRKEGKVQLNSTICLQVDYALVGAGAADDGGGDACVALVSHISADLPWNHLAHNVRRNDFETNSW
jgi:hypothetical protein